MGNATASPGIDVVRLPAKNHYITQPAEVKYKTVLPESCREALKWTNKIVHQASVLDAASAKQLDLMESARAAMADEDMNRLGKVMGGQYDLENATMYAVQQLSSFMVDFNPAQQQCLQSKY